jgi:hypothetical protein
MLKGEALDTSRLLDVETMWTCVKLRARPHFFRVHLTPIPMLTKRRRGLATKYEDELIPRTQCRLIGRRWNITLCPFSSLSWAGMNTLLSREPTGNSSLLSEKAKIRKKKARPKTCGCPSVKILQCFVWTLGTMAGESCSARISAGLTTVTPDASSLEITSSRRMSLIST